MMVETTQSVLSDDMLAGCAASGLIDDQENRFFDEDVAALRNAGYGCLNVRKELGGLGLSLPLHKYYLPDGALWYAASV